MTLKYANTAKIGERIRAYDFRPCSDRPNRYVEGVVVASGDIPGRGFHAFSIKVDFDSVDWGSDLDNRVGLIVYVPHESSMDYNGRVVNLSSQKEVA